MSAVPSSARSPTIEEIVKSDQSVLLPPSRRRQARRCCVKWRVSADEIRKLVIIVDTWNRIDGDGAIPHPAIGSARRMKVERPQEQHNVMIEAVENHMPEVIVIDEIGTELEAQAARTIAERGVQLVGTAHGNTLENLMANPTLSDLVGGIQSVTLGDEEARRRGTQKSVLERRAPPTFPVVVEIQNWDRVAVHSDVAETVDGILRGYRVPAQVRELGTDGEIRTLNDAEVQDRAPPAHMLREHREGALVQPPLPDDAPVAKGQKRIYPFGISRKRLQQAMKDTSSGASIAERLEDTDVVLTDRNYYRRNPQALREAEARGIPIYVLRSNTLLQMQQALLSLQGNGRTAGTQDMMLDAMTEAEEAIHTVMQQDRPIELTPQRAYIRRLQHELAQRFNLSSQSKGREPQRRVRILPGGRGGTIHNWTNEPSSGRSSRLQASRRGIFVTFEGGEGPGKARNRRCSRKRWRRQTPRHPHREPSGTKPAKTAPGLLNSRHRPHHGASAPQLAPSWSPRRPACLRRHRRSLRPLRDSTRRIRATGAASTRTDSRSARSNRRRADLTVLLDIRREGPLTRLEGSGGERRLEALAGRLSFPRTRAWQRVGGRDLVSRNRAPATGAGSSRAGTLAGPRRRVPRGLASDSESRWSWPHGQPTRRA